MGRSVLESRRPRGFIARTTLAAYLTPPTTRELLCSRCEDRSPAHLIATKSHLHPFHLRLLRLPRLGLHRLFTQLAYTMWLCTSGKTRSIHGVRLIPVGEHGGLGNSPTGSSRARARVIECATHEGSRSPWRFAQFLPRCLPEGLWTCMDVHSHALSDFLPFLGGIWLLVMGAGRVHS
ncbi:hypothetical protein C8F01DRAFT_1143346 [Mycena amicta]|nr:hypothetical protein C8F01DRAFT_1143346 [Mycena amicta]